MKKINIRKASINDLEQVSKVVLEAFVSEINGNIKELEDKAVTNQAKFFNYYREMNLSNIPNIIYIAELDNKIIGVAGGNIHKHHWGDSIWGSEDFWFVKKEYRGSKAGLLLFNKLIEWFKNNGAERIQMTHYTWNPKVEDFYRAKGFKPFEINYVYKVK